MSFLNQITKKALKIVFERYFCPETELFYEFTIDEQNNAWFHLPTPEDIEKQIPNPCGWGTGMEDSTMNGGTAIDALITLYEMTKDENVKKCINAIFRGLMRCSENSKDEGFISRSISPFDGKSHYIESSRDQYTHWIYGVLRFYDSELCDEVQKQRIRVAINGIARKCERDVIGKNEYHMLREDGSVGMVNKMWEDVGTHEWLRLPMFYLAAFYVSGDEHWKCMYLKYRDEALEKSMSHNPEKMRCYGSLQMQCSLRVIYDYDKEKCVSEKVMDLMQRNALYGKEKALKNSREYCREEHQKDINFRFCKWDNVEPLKMGIFKGYNNDNPAQSERKDNPAFYPVREVAEGAIMALMCPGFEITDDLRDAVNNMAENIDFEKHSSIYAPLLLSCADIYLQKYE